MALVAADETLEAVNIWSRPFAFRVPGADPGGEPHGGLHSIPGEPGEPGGRFGLGADRSGMTEVGFFDGAGSQQDSYDAATTERVEVATMVQGEIARDGWSAQTSRTRRMTFTGLAGEETHRTVNGSGDSTTRRSRHTEDGDRTYEMSGTFAYTDVVVPVPGSEPRYPTSGTISRSMTATRTDAEGSETRSIQMTITFDGDATALVVVDGEPMELDLSTREGRHPLHGRRERMGG
jgi:hypothetical protein